MLVLKVTLVVMFLLSYVCALPAEIVAHGQSRRSAKSAGPITPPNLSTMVFIWKLAPNRVPSNPPKIPDASTPKWPETKEKLRSFAHGAQYSSGLALARDQEPEIIYDHSKCSFEDALFRDDNGDYGVGFTVRTMYLDNKEKVGEGSVSLSSTESGRRFPLNLVPNTS
ncbi:hypothetical protein EV361DRAFT_67803 [Lentinula raphanica]|uniref:Uncharacterized protein n=1 Tax=Lentinula raphanica TaxID=153919 RepID=A0AA38UH29_9AGAR|nr:hypothetical protein F5878DRAFT_191379 [Lentinula raphanica]KAJ3973351.1 hypothetical protein EV361DRAFT_67803 [Lentinula raphanica]